MSNKTETKLSFIERIKQHLSNDNKFSKFHSRLQSFLSDEIRSIDNRITDTKNEISDIQGDYEGALLQIDEARIGKNDETKAYVREYINRLDRLRKDELILSSQLASQKELLKWRKELLTNITK